MIQQCSGLRSLHIRGIPLRKFPLEHERNLPLLRFFERAEFFATDSDLPLPFSSPNAFEAMNFSSLRSLRINDTSWFAVAAASPNLEVANLIFCYLDSETYVVNSISRSQYMSFDSTKIFTCLRKLRSNARMFIG